MDQVELAPVISARANPPLHNAFPAAGWPSPALGSSSASLNLPPMLLALAAGRSKNLGPPRREGPLCQLGSAQPQHCGIRNRYKNDQSNKNKTRSQPQSQQNSECRDLQANPAVQ